jgi:hypothetical protein
VVDVFFSRTAFAMGWTFNTDSPDAVTSGPTVAAVGIALTTLSFIVVCIRMYVRGWVVKAIGTGMFFSSLKRQEIANWCTRRLAHGVYLGEFVRIRSRLDSDYIWKFMSLGFMVISVIRESFVLSGNTALESNRKAESRWGLGLKHLSAMPEQNVKTFGLVSLGSMSGMPRLTYLIASVLRRPFVSAPWDESSLEKAAAATNGLTGGTATL